ncbi:hypothetical protein NL676_034424 [Syzygium grande]|nr:hypothetical protein NL676_034424 [Syzygium grande]
MGSEMEIDMITELHMAALIKFVDGWPHSGATIRVSNNKAQFKTYAELKEPDEKFTLAEMMAPEAVAMASRALLQSSAMADMALWPQGSIIELSISGQGHASSP